MFLEIRRFYQLTQLLDLNACVFHIQSHYLYIGKYHTPRCYNGQYRTVKQGSRWVGESAHLYIISISRKLRSGLDLPILKMTYYALAQSHTVSQLREHLMWDSDFGPWKNTKENKISEHLLKVLSVRKWFILNATLLKHSQLVTIRSKSLKWSTENRYSMCNFEI